MKRKPNQITLIEFDNNGRPFSVNRTDSEGYDHKYDVEWCDRDKQLYAEMSGGGYYLENTRHKYWTIPGIEPAGSGEEPALSENRLAELPKEYQGDLWDFAEESDCQYCGICNDMFPDDDLCNHIRQREQLQKSRRV